MTTEHHHNKDGHSSDEELIARLEKKMQSAHANKSGLGANRDIIILIVLVVLVAISGWQAVKLSSLQSGGAAPAVSSPSNSSGGSSLPSSLQKLPSQVGGC